MISFFSALIPALLIATVFYALDRNKEPVKALVRAFALGCLSIVALFLLYLLIGFGPSRHTGGFFNALVVAFYQAGFLEELAKFAVFFAFMLSRKEFDEWYDGILYGVMIGLGFAFIENIEYFAMYLSDMGSELIVRRSLLPTSMHALLGGVMGFYLGKGKFCGVPRKAVNYYTSALVTPVLLHGVYDFVIFWYNVDLGWLAAPIVGFLWFKVIRFKKISQTTSPLEPELRQELAAGSVPGPAAAASVPPAPEAQPPSAASPASACNANTPS